MAAPPTATTGSASPEAAAAEQEIKKWPGWPGDNVFRLIVPVTKVGSIIGRKGDLIKKLCEDTRAFARVLEPPAATADRIVLVSGKEEPEAELSPAMEAVLRIAKRINGLTEADWTSPASTPPAVCAVRLLVATSQGITLIGKQGSSIKLIQESSGATIRVLTGDGLPSYATVEERLIEIQGESLKVLSALEAVLGHLRKFLVDHSVLPLFEKNLNVPVAQDLPQDPWDDKTQSSFLAGHNRQQTTIGSDYPPSSKRDSLYVDRESQFDPHLHRSGLSLYGPDPALSGLRTAGAGRTTGGLITQVTQTMQIPLTYAEDIIGVGGRNIAYIRETSGAVITIHETRANPDEIMVEIKGTSAQIQTAQRLIEEFVSKGQTGGSYAGAESGLRAGYPGAESGLRARYPGAESGFGAGYRGAESGPRGSYTGAETGLRSSYFGSMSYSSSLPEPPLGEYGSGLGGHGSYRY